MSKRETLLEEALKLPPVERAELIEKLLSSFEFRSRKTIDALWAREADDRIEAYEQGKIAAVPADDVFSEIEKNRVLMKIEFLEPAKIEFTDALLYYNDQSEGLGYEFAAEVNRTIGRIVRYPEAWPQLSNRTRRCRTNRFPYGLIYQIRYDSILIVAVMHLSRNPETWKKRLRKRD